MQSAVVVMAILFLSSVRPFVTFVICMKMAKGINLTTRLDVRLSCTSLNSITDKKLGSKSVVPVIADLTAY